MNTLNYNNAKRICREVMIRIAGAFLSGKLFETIDRIPLNMRPTGHETTRCCVYKDRAVIKYRCMAALGMPAEEETDELTPLSEYARQALDGEFLNKRHLTVLDVACSTCKKSHYHITNACRACAARPCTLVCHKKAIRIHDGQAEIDMNKCVNCGKCMKVCPYHAIVRIPIPCREACPVNAIEDDENGRKVINEDKCIHCGKCINACPFGAIMECSQLINVLDAIGSDAHVTAMPAPAIVGQFPAEWPQLERALLAIGFDSVRQVAEGAELTIEHEAVHLPDELAKGKPFMTSSCCPAYVQSVKKHVPELADFVMETPSPMQYTAKLAKQAYPETKTVFIGPCTAKRTEAADCENVDYVLTFEELAAIFVAAEVLPEDMPAAETGQAVPSVDARRFAVSGGVAQAVSNACKGKIDLKPARIENLDKKNIALLRQYARGNCPGSFLEVMACAEGCVGGPCTLQKPARARKTIETIHTPKPA